MMLMRRSVATHRIRSAPAMPTQRFLPFALPATGEDEIAAVVDVLRSGRVTTGPMTRRFEAGYCAFPAAAVLDWIRRFCACV